MGKEAYIRYVNESDATVKKALEILERDEAFRKLRYKPAKKRRMLMEKKKNCASVWLC